MANDASGLRPLVAPTGRILFVDDDPFYRDLAAGTLDDARYNVTLADGGAAALAALDGGAFDLLVLDLAMPDVSGFEVLEQLRAGKKQANMPVLVITGHDDAESVARAFDIGATSFLAKPLNWMLLVHHVQFVLKAARAEADLRRATRTAEFMSDLKSRLVGTLVTEFQGPLRSGLGFAKLLKEEADGPIESLSYKAWVAELHHAMEKLNTTHLKMLNFGRSLSEQIDINEEVVQLAIVVDGVVEALADAARRRQISLVVQSSLPVGLEIRGDSVLLAQALRGILENAVKFSKRASEIVLRLDKGDNGHLSIEIDDQTPPLSATQIDEILGVKALSVGRADTVALSTGLKMSRVLMEAHQGAMHLRSTGEGMLTELRLPRARVLGLATPDVAASRLRDVAAALRAQSGGVGGGPMATKSGRFTG
jgi:two-component system, sensor histidine kinase and response regulator